MVRLPTVLYSLSVLYCTVPYPLHGANPHIPYAIFFFPLTLSVIFFGCPSAFSRCPLFRVDRS